MLDAGNPYVLPSVLVGAAVYLGLTVATDASLLIRVGVLLAFVAVVPVVLNRLLGDRGGPTSLDDGDESTAATAGEDAGDDGAR
ncbi:hypothetical protein C463_03023 [Halorubrum californiense DSM 19288]|uniref:Uncharacterized protein n=1 Tax=Halorubrum californiense DSM 19288 TaxID=1227465 RepID=M0EHM4_9EURY|nr:MULTISPECIES: hypothetical protein [Halorubrum]ELZ47255.1 hypothetical protein C463_03023 [Halorubrum californiense DSM 19288]TKX70133.1 hypothetical protein EXE40_09635 [Halorubrum sp. GN11GM_10-3_MGM]